MPAVGLVVQQVDRVGEDLPPDGQWHLAQPEQVLVEQLLLTGKHPRVPGEIGPDAPHRPDHLVR